MKQYIWGHGLKFGVTKNKLDGRELPLQWVGAVKLVELRERIGVSLSEVWVFLRVTQLGD